MDERNKQIKTETVKLVQGESSGIFMCAELEAKPIQNKTIFTLFSHL